MDKDTDISRNRPSEEGRRNDPNIRDESAIQPGVNTNSESKYDDNNQHVTKSAMDDQSLRQFDVDKNADPAFDDISGDDK